MTQTRTETVDQDWAVREAPLRQGWRGAVTAAILNVVGMPLDWVIGRGVPGLPHWPALVSIGVGVLLLVVLLRRRDAPTRRLVAVAFLVNTSVVASALWATGVVHAASDVSWSPFQAEKLGILIVAMLAPEIWVGVVGIAVHALAGIVGLVVLEGAAERVVSAGEPWVIVAYAFVGCVLLAYRLRSIVLEREMLRAHAEAAALDRMARTFLAVRDLANTPLQIIEFNAALLRKRCADSGATVARIDRAVERMHALNSLLGSEESRNLGSVPAVVSGETERPKRE